MLFFSLILFITNLISVLSQELTCNFTLTTSDNIAATYNLAPFYLSDSAYVVNSSGGSSTDEFYQYVYNICGNIPSSVFNSSLLRSQCITNSGSPCIHIDETTRRCSIYYNTTGFANGTAFQVHYGDNICARLGTIVPTMNSYRVTLYDDTDPTAGVVYEIMYGAFCPNSAINRDLRIELLCPHSANYYFTPSSVTNIAEFVYESPDCTFTITYSNPLACPQECITNMGKNGYAVCSGKGICAKDPNLKAVTCLCDDGYSGSQCQKTAATTETVTTKDSGLLAAIIICVVLLAIVILLATYLCYRIRTRDGQGKGQHYFEPILENQETGAKREEAISMDMQESKLKSSEQEQEQPQENN